MCLRFTLLALAISGLGCSLLGDPSASLIEGARNDDPQAIERALARGANPNTRDPESGFTPLVYTLDKPELAKKLLAAGADPNYAEGAGISPLSYACGMGSTASATMLIERGALVSARGRDGTAPIHFAAEGESPATIDLLVSKGTDVNLADNLGMTPLIHAAMAPVGQRPDMIKKLLQHGAKRDQKDAKGLTALAWAIKLKRKAAVQALSY